MHLGSYKKETGGQFTLKPPLFNWNLLKLGCNSAVYRAIQCYKLSVF